LNLLTLSMRIKKFLHPILAVVLLQIFFQLLANKQRSTNCLYIFFVRFYIVNSKHVPKRRELKGANHPIGISFDAFLPVKFPTAATSENILIPPSLPLLLFQLLEKNAA